MSRMYQHRGLELITISADAPEGETKGIGVPPRRNGSLRKNYLFAGNDKYKLMDAVDEKSFGTLPHTIMIAPGGKVLYSKSGPCEPLEIREAIVGYLGRTYK